MVLSGIVESVIFRNDENGYTVIDFVADSGMYTAVGIFPEMRGGESLTLVGELKDSKYGEQFTVTEVQFDSPTDIDGIMLYLTSGLFKGVGERTAREIVNVFGVKTLDIIENAPEMLVKVKGISKKRAMEIAKSYREHLEMQNSIIYLQKLGITMSKAIKIIQAYGDNTITTVGENPYRLVDDIEGIGFIIADRIAEKVGIDKESDFRVYAGIIHTLQEASSRKGHSCLLESELIKESAELLETDEERIIGCLPKLIINNKIVIYNAKSDDGETVCKYVALAVNYNTENSISARLLRLMKEAHPIEFDVQKEIEQYEERNWILLNSIQKEAITTAVNSGMMVITGGPGTGKTTIIKCIIEILTARGKKVSLCAPTGRAAKRMSEATGEEASTIHRMLNMVYENGKYVFKKNELNQLETDVIIVDETSMADIYIFNALLKAVRLGSRLILVGDKDQLPSVSCGNILSDVINSNTMPVIRLTQIYRQDENSLIAYNAQKINKGEMPEINNRSKDFFFDYKVEGKEIADNVVQMLSTRLVKHFGISRQDIQVLAPLKRGYAGVENLNKLIQKELNPVGKQLTVGENIFRVGDKVMHIINDYDIEWEKFDGSGETGQGIFNGEIGYIKDVSAKGEILVEYDEYRRAIYTKKNVEELTLAYAVSVHKGQGSEFPAVILALSPGSGQLLNRNLLYTAVTRAKNLVVIVGDKVQLEKMVRNNYTDRRYTLLKELILENVRKIKMIKGE